MPIASNQTLLLLTMQSYAKNINFPNLFSFNYPPCNLDQFCYNMTNTIRSSDLSDLSDKSDTSAPSDQQHQSQNLSADFFAV